MVKTKMGVPIALIGAAMYFLGVINFTTAVILAGCVLIMDDNEWVRRQALKAISVVIFFNVLYEMVNWLDEFCGIINIFVHWGDEYAKTFEIPANITSLLRRLISLTEDILLVIMGFMALKMKSIRLGLIDNLIDRLLGILPQAPQFQNQVPPMQQPYQNQVPPVQQPYQNQVPPMQQQPYQNQVPPVQNPVPPVQNPNQPNQ